MQPKTPVIARSAATWQSRGVPGCSALAGLFDPTTFLLKVTCNRGKGNEPGIGVWTMRGTQAFLSPLDCHVAELLTMAKVVKDIG